VGYPRELRSPSSQKFLGGHFDEEIQQRVANLSEDEAAAIDRMFDELDEPPRT